MTFVVGFKCLDGIAVIADSEESDGYIRRDVPKIQQKVSQGEWGICFAGSGPGAIVDKLWEEIDDELSGDEFVSYNKRKIVKAVHACMAEKRVAHPDASDYFTAVVGLFGVEKNDKSLYRWEGSSLGPKDRCCVGLDTTLANFVVEAINDPLVTVEECVGQGILVTALMKNHADGVSGPTNAVLYRNGDWEWKEYDQGQIAEAEAQMQIGEFYWVLNRQWRLAWSGSPTPVPMLPTATPKSKRSVSRKSKRAK